MIIVVVCLMCVSNENRDSLSPRHNSHANARDARGAAKLAASRQHRGPSATRRTPVKSTNIGFILKHESICISQSHPTRYLGTSTTERSSIKIADISFEDTVILQRILSIRFRHRKIELHHFLCFVAFRIQFPPFIALVVHRPVLTTWENQVLSLSKKRARLP